MTKEEYNNLQQNKRKNKITKRQQIYNDLPNDVDELYILKEQQARYIRTHNLSEKIKKQERKYLDIIINKWCDKKLESIKANSNPDIACYKAMGEAIIEQTLLDYQEALRILKYNPTHLLAQQLVAEVETFVKDSNYFYTITAGVVDVHFVRNQLEKISKQVQQEPITKRIKVTDPETGRIYYRKLSQPKKSKHRLK